MRLKTWKATVKLSNGHWQEVFVEADTYLNAKAMIERQYGKSNVLGTVSEVR